MLKDTLPGSSLRACAGLYGVSLKTSWFTRMRPCEVMARACQFFRRGEAVSWRADGTYLSESFKGNRSRSARPMPRGARREGRLRGRRLVGHGQRAAPEAQAVPRLLRWRVRQAPVLLPGLVRAGEALGLAACEVDVGPRRRGVLREPAGHPRGSASALLGVLSRPLCQRWVNREFIKARPPGKKLRGGRANSVDQSACLKSCAPRCCRNVRRTGCSTGRSSRPPRGPRRRRP